jgi:hypothetical protein
MAKRQHRCPSRCHRCPLAEGMLIPGCMGMAARRVCTCPSAAEREAELLEKIKNLESTVSAQQNIIWKFRRELDRALASNDEAQVDAPHPAKPQGER